METLVSSIPASVHTVSIQPYIHSNKSGVVFSSDKTKTPIHSDCICTIKPCRPLKLTHWNHQHSSDSHIRTRLFTCQYFLWSLVCIMLLVEWVINVARRTCMRMCAYIYRSTYMFVYFTCCKQHLFVSC